MLKDLIISNSRADEELQSILDQYEKTGDTSGLQRLISEGRLLQQKDTFHLLDDLDLDFLNVGIDGGADQNDEEFERLVDAGTPIPLEELQRGRADSNQMLTFTLNKP
mmetsp:Transcript_25171/g.36061  ORF Transcript_25171/g.36061 Transcript_25171/m.36061 type:complete len:108 (+) Transcript_25171:749-1072(+)